MAYDSGGSDPTRPISRGNPPRATQFGGERANPRCDQIVANKAKRLRRSALGELEELVNYGTQDDWLKIAKDEDKRANFIVRQFARAIVEGNVKQMNFCFEQVFGKAPQKVYNENSGTQTQVLIYRPEKRNIKKPDEGTSTDVQ